MSDKKLVAVATHPCRGFVTTVRFKEDALIDETKLESLMQEEVFPEVQHFSDGRTRVLCARVERSELGHQYCGLATDEHLQQELQVRVSDYQEGSCPYAQNFLK